jgi:hypothetical protein
LFKKTKIKKTKKAIIDAVYLAYKWGYSDKENKLPLKSLEEVETSFNKGFDKTFKKQ